MLRFPANITLWMIYNRVPVRQRFIRSLNCRRLAPFNELAHSSPYEGERSLRRILPDQRLPR